MAVARRSETLRSVRLFACVSFVLVSSIPFCVSSHVVRFDIGGDRLGVEEEEERDIGASVRERRGTPSEDKICSNQEGEFLQEIRRGKRLETKYSFDNETNYSMALAWAGENNGVIIVVTTHELLPGWVLRKSNIYRSSDYGKHFELINHKIDNKVIKKLNGLQRHSEDPQRVYVVTYGENGKSLLYITEDGGLTFHQFELNFICDEPFVFNKAAGRKDWLLTRAPSNENNLKKDLYITTNNGRHWMKIASNVGSFHWGTGQDGDTIETVYAAIETEASTTKDYLGKVYNLKKSVNGDVKWVTLLSNVVTFGIQEKFLYASVLTKNGDERLLRISTSAGQMWYEAQLPTITHDRFYSVLDMSEGLVFMHVDDPGDTGHGTLYTSAQLGVIYSESLKRHLYPNFKELTDFYKVESMKGVYFASQINEDDSIHTMITFNRGASWQVVRRPENAECKDETKPCYLQIHSMYSVSRSLNVQPPLSSANAVGIVLVHGHIADALQTTKPDVFVTSDGGYNWRKALAGPHHYQIADSGGLLIAVPSDTSVPSVVKFSTDEGRCWHEYQFTNESIIFTGLLTEPGSKTMTVGIWGYGSVDRRWRVHIINFKDVIKKACDVGDYEDWLAHSELRKDEGSGMFGCLLGSRETFRRLKKDSWCFNGYSHLPTKVIATCVCSMQDYLCDYGYHRVLNNCVKEKDFKSPDVDVCLRGHEEKIITEGYRKIPGDTCTGGFNPKGKKIDLNEKCHEGSKSLIIEMEEPHKKKSSHFATVIISLVIIIGLIFVAVLAYFVHNICVLRRHKVVYRYSLLNQSEECDYDNEFENALSSQKAVYHDSSEDDDMVGKKGKSKIKSFHDDSDDDMLE